MFISKDDTRGSLASTPDQANLDRDGLISIGMRGMRGKSNFDDRVLFLSAENGGGAAARQSR